MKKTALQQVLAGIIVCLAVLLPTGLSGQINLTSTLNFKAEHVYDEHKALSVSANGDMYISMNATKLSILTGSNQVIDYMNTMNSVRAGILAKIDVNKNVVWTNMVGADAVSAKNSQVISATEVGDYVYVVGGVASNVNTLSPVNVFGIGLQSQGFMDYYIAKLNSSTGQAVWVKSFGSTRDWEMFVNLAADANGNIYTAGYFGNISSGPLEFSENHKLSVNGNWGEDYFVVRFNADGDLVWAKNFGSRFREHDDIFGLSIDKNGDAYLAITSNDRSRADLTNEAETKREYIVGTTSYYLYPESKMSDAMLIKLSAADGTALWSRFFTGTGNQRLEHVTALSGSADVVVVGKADQNIVIQGSDGFQEKTVSHPLSTGSNYFMMSFDASGNYRWYTSPQGEMDIRALRNDDDNGFYVGGSFNTYVALNAEIMLQATDGNVKEGFLARYNTVGECLQASPVQGIGGQSIKRIDVKGTKMVVSGDRLSDAIFPFSINGVAYEVDGVTYKWYALSYDVPVTVSGVDKSTSGLPVSFVNPVTDGVLKLTINGSGNQEYVLRLTDISGRIVVEHLLDATTGIQNVATSSLTKGIYILKVIDRQGNISIADKLIIK